MEKCCLEITTDLNFSTRSYLLLLVVEEWKSLSMYIVRCCWNNNVQESFDNFFINYSNSNKVWRYFADASKIQGPFIKVRQAIEVWWKAKCVIKFKSLCKVTLSLIIWHKWKRRNLIRHGYNMTTRAMIVGITRDLVLFANLLPGYMRKKSNAPCWP